MGEPSCWERYAVLAQSPYKSNLGSYQRTAFLAALADCDRAARNVAVALFGVACLEAAERGAVWVSLREAGLWKWSDAENEVGS